MDPEQLQIVLGQLAQALGLPPPPPLAPDQVTSARSAMSQLLAALGVAANSGDPADLAAAEGGYSQRELKTGQAMTKFPANEEQSAQALQQLMGTAQQIPQQISGIGQGIGGMFGGFFQALNQALQQGVQAGSQLGNAFEGGGQGAALAGELPADALGAGGGLLGAGAGAAGAAGGALEGTAPAGNLGPPPTPSAGTFPASSPPAPPPPPAAEPSTAPRGAMGGYPMMPPGPMGGPAGSDDAKADTKRVVGPTVKNGAPVQGRITTPPPVPEVIKRVEGKPVAARRILAHENKHDTDDTADSNH
ncbi:hypothetical protein [Mycobacterium sp.]|uniref:hypothetical protein n=1 Tax=Mycobacterium sp. TaxID=1785 RepID=UPI003D6BDC51